MNKVLIMTPYFMYPIRFGGIFDIYYSIKEVLGNNQLETYLISFFSKNEKPDIEHALSLGIKDVKLYKRNYSISNLLTTDPFHVSSRYSSNISLEIINYIRDNQISFVLLHSAYLGKYALDIKAQLPNVYVAIRVHNIERKFFRELGKSESNIFRKGFFYLESLKFGKHEAMYYSVANEIFPISLEEYDILKQIQKNITYFPPFMELPDKDKIIKAEPKVPTILFAANLSGPNNLFGLRWLIEKILPKVKKDIPQLKLVIAGSNPSEEIINIKSDSIEKIFNYQDISDVFKKADIVVAPIFHGAGVKTRIIEALNYEKIVITTSKGVEGTQLTNMSEILVSDNADEFANYVIKALTDSDLQSRLRKNVTKYKNTYSRNNLGDLIVSRLTKEAL